MHTVKLLPCAAHGKRHMSFRRRQRRSLSCATYRAHNKPFAVCKSRPTAKKIRCPGMMTWPDLYRVPCRCGTRQSSNLCRVPWFLHTAKIGTFAVCHGFCTQQRCQNQFFCLIITYMVPPENHIYHNDYSMYPNKHHMHLIHTYK